MPAKLHRFTVLNYIVLPYYIAVAHPCTPLIKIYCTNKKTCPPLVLALPLQKAQQFRVLKM